MIIFLNNLVENTFVLKYTVIDKQVVNVYGDIKSKWYQRALYAQLNSCTKGLEKFKYAIIQPYTGVKICFESLLERRYSCRA